MSADVERLADDLAAADAAHFACGGCEECEDQPTLHAATPLASPWLAAHGREDRLLRSYTVERLDVVERILKDRAESSRTQDAERGERP